MGINCAPMAIDFTPDVMVIPEKKHYQKLAEFFPATEGFEVARRNLISGTITTSFQEGPVGEQHYIKHLFESKDDKTQVRVVPASATSAERVSWLAFDMPALHDITRPGLLDTLEGREINVYLADDPLTQRLLAYVFLKVDVPRQEAERLAEKLRNVLQDEYGGSVHAFPAGKHQARKQVALPFLDSWPVPRGDATLLGPGAERRQYKNFHEWILKTSPADVAALPDLGEPLLTEESVSPPDGAIALWRREVARLGLYWHPDHAQNLSLALAGLGTYLGVDEQEASEAVRKIVEKFGDLHPEERLGAVTSTYKKWRNKSPVAYRVFYERAGLTPPTVKGKSRIILQKLDSLQNQIPDHDWLSRTRTNDQVVYRKLIEFAQKHGKVVEGGIEIRVSERDLALKAGLSRKTIQAAIKRLKELGLANRTKVGTGIAAGSYRLICEDQTCTDLPQSSYPYLVNDWGNFVHIARNGRGCLGKAAVEALVVLTHSKNSMSSEEWATALGTKKTLLRRRRDKLAVAGLIVTAENKHRYAPVADWQAKLLKIFEEEGSFQKRDRDRDKYEKERMTYKALDRRVQ